MLIGIFDSVSSSFFSLCSRKEQLVCLLAASFSLFSAPSFLPHFAPYATISLGFCLYREAKAREKDWHSITSALCLLSKPTLSVHPCLRVPFCSSWTTSPQFRIQSIKKWSVYDNETRRRTTNKNGNGSIMPMNLCDAARVDSTEKSRRSSGPAVSSLQFPWIFYRKPCFVYRVSMEEGASRCTCFTAHTAIPMFCETYNSSYFYVFRLFSELHLNSIKDAATQMFSTKVSSFESGLPDPESTFCEEMLDSDVCTSIFTFASC